MTGLYDNIHKLQEDKSLTFLYRAPKIFLSGLDMGSVAESYERLLGMPKDESIRIARMTKGYAYAYQVLGYLMFDSGSKSLTSDLVSQFDQYMSEYVYEKVFPELSGKEQEIVGQIGDDGAISVSELCSRTGLNIKTISVYRDRLIKKGVLFSPRYGALEFALPRFWQFVRFHV